MSVAGKVALVTGGASGMCRAGALLMARHGARVVVADRDGAGAQAVRDEIEAAGGEALDVGVDVGDSKAVAAMVAQAEQRFGRIDVLVHGAGICPRKPLLEMGDDDWRDVLRINLDGSFYVCRDVGRVMARQRSGTMILVASDRGVNGSIDYAHYAASKGGMIALTKSLALALGQYGVTVNALNPGITDTPLARAAVTEWDQKMRLDVLGTCSRPEDIAETILFLAGTGGRYTTGQLVGTRMRYGAVKYRPFVVEEMSVAAKRKVIITCAVTGSIHTPSMSPHLPITPAEIADAAVGAAEAGAAIVHLHARDPVDGRPTQDPKYFREFAADIRRRSDVVINFTTGGAATMPIEERLQPALQLKPEVASLNMGSMNFGLYPMLERFKEFRHEWERPYLAESDGRIFRNTFKDIAHILESCRANATRFEIECYDIGHLYTAAHFLDRKLVEPPLFIQSVFGILGGIGGHPEDVMQMRRTADRLFGDDYVWSVLGAGRNQMPIATMSTVLGGNVRVGLEDSLWLGPGTLARTNAEQVTRIRSIIEALSLEVATPDEARRVLKLKGGDAVEF